ncbi:MAG: enoyl-CoA hydratase/isomerase family protein [Proteobacteria bacterium]|nr:enoyl-CoA hydratase/isomerase family protein [Pseudomonadota bacterium]
MADPVLLERNGDVAVIVLNRADKLNALNKAMWIGVRDLARTCSADDTLRCVVLRGAGETAFSPGADIAEFPSERADARQAASYGQLMHETMGAIADCRHPTVAMIHGLCVGGGLELAIMCDLRICGEASRFGVPINRIGVTMAYPEIGALIALVGRATALEILFEGRVFGAAEAKDKGLVTRVVPDAQVTDEALAAARRIAEGAPLVNRWHKKFARRLDDATPLSAAERAEPYETFDTEDYRAGFQAFLDKRKVVFKGR